MEPTIFIQKGNNLKIKNYSQDLFDITTTDNFKITDVKIKDNYYLISTGDSRIFSMPANRQLCFHQSSGRQLMPLPLPRNCSFHFPSALSAYLSGFCNLEKEQRFQSPFSKTTGHFYRNNLSSSSKYPNTLHKMSGHFQQKNLTIPTGFSDTPPPEAL